MSSPAHGGLTRRGLFAGTAAAAGAAAVPGVAAARKSKRKAPRRVDVAVIGAGLSGVAAAREVARAGHSFVLLEARDRVGGRTLNERIAPGGFVEHGGTFLFSAEREDVLVGLASEVGVDVFTPPVSGENVYVRNGERKRYDRTGPLGRVPPEPSAIPDLVLAVSKLDETFAGIPPEAPWTAERAVELDSQTFDTWLRDNTSSENSRFLLGLLLRTLAAVEPRDVSLLSLGGLVAGSGMTLQQIIESTATARFAQGAQEISLRQAQRLGSSVVLSSPVRRIVEERSRARVESDRLTVLAKRVIVAMAPAMTPLIDYQPPLTGLRMQLGQRFPQGTLIRCHAVYSHPWWREEGMSGESLTDLEPVRVTADVTPPEGRPGLLAAYINGSSARRWSHRSQKDRGAAVIDNLVTLFGPRAADVELYIDRAWTNDPWTRGCLYGITPPGVLLDYGPTIRAPVGRIHWAGTETADAGAASLEGAVRAGARAANEAMARL